MKDFAVIDFETANHHRTSVCSVGVVIVRDGVVVDKIYRLTKPYPNYYCGWATDCHGLSFHDTKGADSFNKVWEEIAHTIDGLQLVAHNSPFDESHLIACYEHWNIPYTHKPFLCTLKASRERLKGLENYQLHTVAAHCGYVLHNHHHALADAEACAIIAIKIL